MGPKVNLDPQIIQHVVDITREQSRLSARKAALLAAVRSMHPETTIEPQCIVERARLFEAYLLGGTNV